MKRGWRPIVIGGLLAASAAGAGVRAQGPVDALASLVAAEKAFARMSVDTSQRDAFLANFADEGVWFTPAPSFTRADLQKRPPTPLPQARVLDWEPWTGDIAASGDLGYTTGPWTQRAGAAAEADRKLLATGWFFSVWQRQADRTWKVLADCGVGFTHDGALRAQPFQRARVRAVAPSADVGTQALGVQLRAADVELARQISEKGWAGTLAELATVDVRVYRDGQAPSIGLEGAGRLLPTGKLAFGAEPRFARASAAGDLGVTYGAYQAGAERGYYVHVWKRRDAGWRLAVDFSNVEAPVQR